MKHKKQTRKAASQKTLRTRIAAAMLAVFFFATSMPETVLAINTNIPDLLVNTESFQTIDPGDGTSVIDLRFGETLNARLYYDTSASRFNFTKDVWVQGVLTATGTITTKRTLSGNTLVISRNGSFSGALTVVGNATIKGTLSGNIIHSEKTLASSGTMILSQGNPRLSGTYNTSGNSKESSIVGTYAYVADNDGGLQVLDISNPVSPSLVGSYATSANALAIDVVGRFAYIAADTAGLVIVDISNPVSPVLVGSYDTSGNAADVVIAGRYAYVAGQGSGLQVIDISNPASPILVGTYDTSGRADALSVLGRFAYVADGGSGLHIIDISNPATPVLVSTYNTSGWARGVVVIGRYAYVADEGSGLQIVDVKDPTTPTSVSTFATTADAFNIDVAGRYAFIPVSTSGIQVVDISTVATPVHAGGYDTSGISYGVTVAGRYAFVGDGTSGLQVVSLNFLDAPTARIGALETDTLSVRGDTRVNNNLVVDRSLDVGDGLYVFGQSSMRAFSGSALTLSTQDKTGKPALNVLGMMSGTHLTISGNTTLSGSAMIKVNATVRGTISGTTINANSLLTGSTLQGFGLYNCQGSANKLTYNSTTKKFLCEADQTGGGPGGSAWSNTGSLMNAFDFRYVKKSGDTMTGALTINLNSGFLGLKIMQMASGSVIHAEKTLTSSGMLKVTQNVIQGSGALVVHQPRNSTGAYLRGSGSHIRHPLLALDSSTGSTHAPHILFGYNGTFDVNLYRATGGVLRTNGSFIATGSVSGAYLTFMGAQSSYILGSLGIGKTLPKAKLDVLGTISGSTLTVSGNGSFSGALRVVGNGLFDGGTLFIDSTNNKVGVNKSTTANTQLEVVGTISGSQLKASNMTVSGAVVYSSGNLLKQTAKGLSGQLLISQGTSAPVWKDQKTSLVWYLDSTIATGSNQSAIVTMPFGLVASTGSLRIKGAPTGSSLIVDLKKDGTTIFSSKPTIPAGAISAKNGVFSTTNLTEGSEISLSVTQVGSTFAGSGLTIMLTGTRKY